MTILGLFAIDILEIFRGDFKKAISNKEVINDMIFRIKRLERKVAV